jgi:hypothetical protein
MISIEWKREGIQMRRESCQVCEIGGARGDSEDQGSLVEWMGVRVGKKREKHRDV